MTDYVWKIIIFTIAFGIILGFLIVVILKLFQGKQSANSLLKSKELIGLSASVEIPFDCYNKGKVRVKNQEKITYYTAITDSKKELALDDQVMIIAIKKDCLFVVPKDELSSH